MSEPAVTRDVGVAVRICRSRALLSALCDRSRYGDSEYDNKEYDRAIDQYINTIGCVHVLCACPWCCTEPCGLANKGLLVTGFCLWGRLCAWWLWNCSHVEASYVIRKFLDAQRIHNLTKYLEALHDRKRAGPDHTTLLLNCYTKLKEDDKLRRFIQGEKKGGDGAVGGAGGDDEDDEVNFQVDTAISVLRDADYLDDALHLAQKHREHEWCVHGFGTCCAGALALAGCRAVLLQRVWCACRYLKILIENLERFADALAYIRDLPFMLAEKYLLRYGHSLVANCPELVRFFGFACADGGSLASQHRVAFALLRHP